MMLSSFPRFPSSSRNQNLRTVIKSEFSQQQAEVRLPARRFDTNARRTRRIESSYISITPLSSPGPQRISWMGRRSRGSRSREGAAQRETGPAHARVYWLFEHVIRPLQIQDIRFCGRAVLSSPPTRPRATGLVVPKRPTGGSPAPPPAPARTAPPLPSLVSRSPRRRRLSLSGHLPPPPSSPFRPPDSRR